MGAPLPEKYLIKILQKLSGPAKSAKIRQINQILQNVKIC
jgi:hypothetical protein